MNRKKGGKIAAVIDIGSNTLKMRVAQVQKGEIEDLDRLEYPLRLGHEVFHSGKISFESLRELSSILRGYSRLMSEYGSVQYKVVATTALREAENRAYVADQLKIQNDMTIEILEDDQEKTLIYSEMLRAVQDGGVDNTLFSYIGTGSIGLAIYEGGRMVFSQNIPMGSLKLHDMLGSIQDETEDFYKVLDEYLDSVIGRITVPYNRKILSSLIITGNEIELIANICGVPLINGKYMIETRLIHELYKTIRVMTTDKISDRYNLSPEQAEVLYSALAIYARMIQLTEADTIISPKIELWDAIIRQMLIPKSSAEYDDHVRNNSISCARILADHYKCDAAHEQSVGNFACLIFDKMKKIHGLGPKRRLLLELAAILHDCGYYVNSKEHLLSTFDLINNTDIYGLTDEEVLLIAHIARYNEYQIPTIDDPGYSSLSEKNRLIVSKLIAIFRVANALDKSQKQKLKKIRVRLDDNILFITGESEENFLLEKWAFNECIPFFEDVFGIKPELVVKPTFF